MNEKFAYEILSGLTGIVNKASQVAVYRTNIHIVVPSPYKYTRVYIKCKITKLSGAHLVYLEHQEVRTSVLDPYYWYLRCCTNNSPE